MNDLAEAALRGLGRARGRVRTHPMTALGGSGLAVSSVVVVAGGQVAAAAPTRPLTSWLGVQAGYGISAGGQRAGAVLFASVVVLALLWLVAVTVARRVAVRPAQVWGVAAAWALPFVLGPPLLDTTVYSYVAYGRLLRGGHDPYVRGPSSLGDSPVVGAIDPAARGLLSSAGPLGTLLQHLAISVSGGGLLGAVLVLRALGVLAVVWIGQRATQLGVRRPSVALALCVLNPLVLLYAVSSPHLEAVTVALLLTALVAARERRWLPAVVLAALAGSVTPQALVALPVLFAAHWSGPAGRARWRRVSGDVAAAAAVVGALGLVQPDGFGWVRTAGRQFSQHTSYSVAGGVALLLRPVVRGASLDDLADGGRLSAAIAAVCVVGYLVVTARRRGPDLGVGYALLAFALLAPVLHPWYLMWGTLCLLPGARGPQRTALQALCVAGCVLTPPGFTGHSDAVLSGVSLAALGVVAGGLLYRRRDPALRLERDDPDRAT